MGVFIPPPVVAAKTAAPSAAQNGLLRANLQDIVTHLENYGERSSWEKQHQAAAWAKQHFKTIGLDSWTETYEKDGRKWTNTFAHIRGKNRPDELILVIAHIDSISESGGSKAPGADDNATGVAVLMELARLMKHSNPDKSIRFCIFSNEERGSLGSKAHVRKVKSESRNISAVINLDILGYNPQKSAVQWKMFLSEASLKYKIKALIKIVANSATGLIHGPFTLRSVGRPKNAGLVKAAATDLRSVDGLIVKEIVDQDCG